MADRSWIEVTCRQSDYDAVLHEYLHEFEEIGEGVVTAWNSEAAGGLFEERGAWAQAGIPFYGEHAACVGAFEAAVFASDGVVHASTMAVESQPAAHMNRNLQYEAEDDEEARRYWNVLARAEQIIHRRT